MTQHTSSPSAGDTPNAEPEAGDNGIQQTVRSSVSTFAKSKEEAIAEAMEVLALKFPNAKIIDHTEVPWYRKPVWTIEFTIAKLKHRLGLHTAILSEHYDSLTGTLRFEGRHCVICGRAML